MLKQINYLPLTIALEKLLDIISNLTNENSGKVYAWDGEEIGP